MRSCKQDPCIDQLLSSNPVFNGKNPPLILYRSECESSSKIKNFLHLVNSPIPTLPFHQALVTAIASSNVLKSSLDVLTMILLLMSSPFSSYLSCRIVHFPSVQLLPLLVSCNSWFLYKAFFSKVVVINSQFSPFQSANTLIVTGFLKSSASYRVI